MTGLENKKSKKTKKKKEAEGEVLERVMDSIEMAGASLDFFEEETHEEVVEKNELDAALSDDIEVMEAETQTNEFVTDETQEGDAVVEAASDEETLKAAGDVDHEEVLEAGSNETADQVDGEEALEASPETVEEGASASLEMDENTENMELLPENNEAEFIDQTQALSIIESLLFSSDRPLGLGTFKQVFKGTNYKTKEIKKALEEMQSVYADTSRGVTLEEINGGWQLRTKVDNMDFLRRLAKARPFKLSGPALEVLAIIAYKQPMVKSEVDEIRGVESGHLVRALMEKNLVCFQGKSELPGKPMQYGTTRKFLEIFGLRNLRELPSLDEIDQLLPDGIGVEEEDEKLSDVTDKMSEEYAGNYSEGEEELLKIQDTLEGIDTSSEFFEEEKRRQKEKRDRDRARDIREALDVGEEVEAKDQKWLARYEEKLVEEAALKEQQEAQAMEAESSEAEVGESSVQGTSIDDISEEQEEIASLTASEPTDEVVEKLDELIATPEEGLSDELSALSNEENSLVDESIMNQDEQLEQEETSLDPFAEIDDEEKESEKEA